MPASVICFDAEFSVFVSKACQSKKINFVFAHFLNLVLRFFSSAIFYYPTGKFGGGPAFFDSTFSNVGASIPDTLNGK
jgi:hypothetical protein